MADPAHTPATVAAPTLGAGPPAPRQEYLLAGSMGAELSGPLLEMEQIIQQLLSTGKLSRQQINSLLLSLGTARRIATQGQMLDRLAHNPIKESHEQVQLDARMRQALADNGSLLQSRAVEIKQRLSPVEVVLDPGLLETLLSAALSWMARPGYRLLISLEQRPPSQHGLLSFKGRPTVSAGYVSNPLQTEPYRLSWCLLCEAASRLQVEVRYHETGSQLMLTLEFSRTLGRLEQLTQPDMDSGGDSWGSSHSRGLIRHRVLLISDEPTLCLDVERICAAAHLLLQVAHTSEQARLCWDLEAPELVILDLRLGTDACAALRRLVETRAPSVSLIEICDEQHSLDMPSWSADQSKLINLSNVRARLPHILAGEIDKRG